MINRISVTDAKQALGNGALLVCVYPEDKYQKVNLEGSISYKELKSRLPSLDNSHTIIFY